MKPFIVLLLLFILHSCRNKQATGNTEEKFDKAKWSITDGRDYPHRDNMLKDLMATDTIKKLKREQVIFLLGEPTRTDSNYVFYRVAQRRLGDFFPLNTKTLVIKFRQDSSVEWTKIHQ